MFKILLFFSQLTFANLVGFWLFSYQAKAQVTPDNTVNTQVNQNGNVSEIRGGETRGGNLFHSFQDFSLPTGREAFFNNADNISNIFSRVTGGNVSNIDGLIRANGSASLFLINPAGIIFGENARLDIGGSFYSSTADSILFEDGEFSATDLDNPPVLTVNAPIGLGFRDNPADITVRGDGNGVRLADSEIIDTQDALRVGENATIGFIGGNLNFENATVKTAGGRIELGSVAGGRVDLVEVANGFSFDYSGIEAFQDISLSGRSSLDASGNGNGDINVAGQNISITGVSGFIAHTLGDETGGDINVFATDEISLNGVENEFNFSSAITSRTFASGTAEAGNINIETGSLSLGDRALITTFSSGQANAGNITINASDSVSLESQGNSSQIISSIEPDVIGNSGDININANSFALTNGALLIANNSGQGNAGNITINTTESISLIGQENGSVITASILADAIGDAGNLSFTTGSLTLDNSSALRANNLGEGNAGNISIESVGNVDIVNDSDIQVASIIGNSGDILISGEFLTLNDNSFLLTRNLDTGNAGNVAINLIEDFNINNNSFVRVDGINGNSGNIDLTIKSLTVDNSPISLFAANNVNGAGGNIIINAVENIFFSNNSSIFATGLPGGLVDINAKNLSLTSGSNIFTGVGIDLDLTNIQSGDIRISLTEDLVLDGLDGIASQNTNISNVNIGRGNAGNIIVNARNISLKNGAEIENFTNNQGNTGDIILNASNNITIDGIGESSFEDRVFTSNSSIETSNTSQLGSANAGKIDITARNLSLTNSGGITSLVTGNGNSGEIDLDISDTIIVDGFSNSILGVDSVEDPDGNVISVADGVIANSEIQSFISPNGQGNSGDININTTNLFLSRNGSIDSSVNGQGNAGDINIDAELITIGERGDITTSPSGINSLALTGFRPDTILEANAGDININTKSLFISDGSSIDSNVSAFGSSGNITINASEEISINGTGTNIGVEIDERGMIIPGSEEETQLSSGISSTVFPSSTGNAGDIEINTPKLSIVDGSVVSNTLGQGNAGAITINASEFIEIIDGNSDTPVAGIFAGALINNGNGGDVRILTQDLTINDGAIINIGNFPSNENSTALPGTGEAGSLTIEANSLSLENNANIDAATQSGDGGNITLDIADNITLRDSSFISARALKDANGGNIDIDTNFIVAFPQGNNDIIATAERGNGGNININAESLFGIQERPLNDSSNDINASSEFSLDGTVTISTPDINSLQGEVNLPTNIIETEETTSQACRNNRESAAKNGLNITGKGGIPDEPGLPQESHNISVNGEFDTIFTTPPAIDTSQGKIQPARGVRVTESGDVVLTAYRTNNSGERIPETRNCY